MPSVSLTLSRPTSKSMGATLTSPCRLKVIPVVSRSLLPSAFSEIEPVDEALEARLQEIQAETDALLVQVTGYRKKYPQIATKNFALAMEKALHAVDQSVAMLKPLDPIEPAKDLPGSDPYGLPC